MIIHLVNENINFNVSVLYNFKQFANCIVLKFDKPLSGERNFVLLYNPITDQWQDIDALDQINPEIFAQVKYKLIDVMQEAKKMSAGSIIPVCKN